VLSTRISAMSFQPLDAGAARVVLNSAALAHRSSERLIRQYKV
jgi:hypothetical protein